MSAFSTSVSRWRSTSVDLVRDGAHQLRVRFGNAWGRFRRNPRSSASTSFLAVSAIGLIVAIVLADGFRAKTYELESAGVWVVNREAKRFGRINARIAEQDGLGTASVPAYDVLQDGPDVFVLANDKTTLHRASASTLDVDSDTVTLAVNSRAAVGGGRFAVIDAAGKVRVASTADATALSVATDPGAGGDPDKKSSAEGEDDENVALDEGPGAVMTIGRQGDIVVASPGKHRVALLRKGVKKPEYVRVAVLDGVVQVSTAGRNPVALFGSVLVLPNGESIEVPGKNPKLQLPSDDAENVVVATDEGVLSYEIDDAAAGPRTLGQTTSTPGAIRPVNVDGCTYAAWTGTTPAVLHVCGGQQQELALASGTPPTALEWKVNGNHAVLNDLETGLVLVVSDGELIKADQWDKKETTGDSKEKSEDRTPDPNFNETENTPPVAKPDSFGARAGMPSILPVLDNDEDADGDVLTVREITNVSGGASAQIVRAGTAVQITPASGQPAGSVVTFNYRITDGWPANEGGCAECTTSVQVTVADPNENRVPTLKENRPAARISVGPKARATYPVLDDWIDPDGDPLVLSSAGIDPAIADVTAQSEGLLTYIDRTNVPGEHSVRVQVSDVPLIPIGGMTADGTIAVTVEGANTPPVARSDYASTAVGQPVVVWPLRNDTDADGDELSYRLIPEGAVPQAARQNADGSVTVTPSTTEPLQFGYEVTDGRSAAVPARIRVDVLAPSAEPPAAGMDLVVLPAPPASGAPSARTVDLLANDVSPSGNVLVVTRVRTSGEPVYGLEFQLREHRRLFVSYKGRLQGSATLEYTVSDGTATARGKVVVVSAESDVNLPPVTVDDEVDVRARDLVSVPVLSNDIDPEGSELYLQSAELVGGDGVAFLAGQRVRFLAPSKAGTAVITYTVSDDPQPGFGTPATGRLTVTIRDSPANAAPAPPPVEARVIAGSSVKITVPLAGIDPDGDSVTLLGLGLEGNVPQAPKLGRISHVGLDTFTYEAFEKPGSDLFRYRVMDTGGPSGEPLEAEGIIRVGVALRDGENRPPTPRSDMYTVRPGPVRLDVVSNDFDPDGDSISLVSAQGPGSLGVGVEDGRVTADFSDVEPATYALTYRIEDAAGLDATATLNVSVDPRATGLAPVARDDLAEPDDPTATRVIVDVLLNDDDPDGDPTQLDVEVVDGSNVDVTEDDGRLSIAVTARTQLVAYRITDQQGLTATAVVRVPPAGTAADLPPVLRPDARAVSTGSETGGPVTVVLDEVAVDPEGKTLRLDGANPIGVNGDATTVDATSFTFTPKPYDRQTGTGPRGRDAASVSFIVSDAPEGQVGRRAVLTLPIDVELTVSAPPRWTSVGALAVSVYEGDEPATLDLRRAVSDADTAASDLSFEITSPKIEGVTIEEKDGVLTAAVGGDSPDPNLELGDVEVQVTDGENTALEPALVPVRTVPTQRALPALATFDTEAESGRSTTVDVLDGATNPFDESVDEALELLPSTIRTTNGSGTAAMTGSREVVFTPEADFVGTAVVSFEVEDIVGRRVPGAITYTVSSVPSAPGSPTARQLSANSVEVAWAAADKHGKEIQKYTVTDQLGRSTRCGVELFCPIDGLTPGVTYTFTVIATNERGDGPASTPSTPIRPDECPAAPTDVQLTFDAATNPKAGGLLEASWTEPDNNGTAIEGYEVRVSPESSSPLTELVKGTSVTLTGLTNGAPHNVTVRAKNQCDGGGLGAEGKSNSETPAGVPDAPRMISAKDAADPTGGRILLTWMPPTEAGEVRDHGDRVIGYSITATEGASGFGTAGVQAYAPSALDTNDDGSVTANLSVNKNLDAYRFTVTATNKAGSGSSSSQSERQTARGTPAAPDLISATFNPNATTNDGQVTVSFRESTDAGDDRISYYYRHDAMPWTVVPGNITGIGGSAIRTFNVPGLEYSKAYAFRMIARNDSYSSAEAGPVRSSAASGVPSNAIYGMFDPPTISCDATPTGQHVRCIWTMGATRGNEVTLQLSGRPLERTSPRSDEQTVEVGYGQSGTQRISASDNHGHSTPESSDPWTTPEAPTVTVAVGDSTTSGGCIAYDGMVYEAQGCYWARITLSNFDPGPHTVRCYMTMSNVNPAVYKQFTFNGNGTLQECSFSSAGRWIMVVVDGVIAGGNSQANQYEWAKNNHTGVLSNVSPQWPTN